MTQLPSPPTGPAPTPAAAPRPAGLTAAGRFGAAGRPGFTLIELLVVIGIIVLLIAILLPVAGRVRISAQTARTWASMSAIASAIERYHSDEHVYPGIYTNDQIQQQPASITISFVGNPAGASSELTQTENMVLSLAGGLEVDPSIANPVTPGYGQPKIIKVDETTSIGKGPVNFSSAAQYQTRRGAYIDASPGGLLPSRPYSNTGCVGLNNDLIGKAPAAGIGDSSVPEFLDAYTSHQRPILLLRANVGAVGDSSAGAYFGVCTPMTAKNPTITGTPKLEQYTTYEFSRYARGAAPNPSDFPGDFQWNLTNDTFEFYQNEAMYLRHPSIANSPKSKDKFIMISAGPDGVFGTKDDIFYGGN